MQSDFCIHHCLRRVIEGEFNFMSMDHQSPPRRSGIPLGDLTNTYQTEGLQKESASKERKRQRDKERYAAMSREKKDERNRKDRERRRMKKALEDGNQLGQVHVPMTEHHQQTDVRVTVDSDDDYEWLHRGQLTQNNQNIVGGEVLINADSNVQHINHSCIGTTVDGDVRVPVLGDDDNEWLHRGQLTQNNKKRAGGEVLINSDTNGEAINDNCIDTTKDEAGGEALTNLETNGNAIDDICIDTMDGGCYDEPNSVDDQNLSPGDRRRRRARARYAELS